MRTPNSFTRRPMIAASALVAAACLLPAGGALANEVSAPAPVVATMNAPEAATLTATPWETTGATNQDGTPVALNDPAVSNFVGYAYYNPNGTFTMYNLDDTPKMQGDWTVDNTNGNLTRTLVAKDTDGNVLFTRVVPITVLNANEFTYRVYPDATNTAVYYDIIHTPTAHAEPVAAPEVPGGGTGGTGGGTAPVATAPDTPSAPGQQSNSAGELAVTGTDAPALGALLTSIAAVLSGAGLMARRMFRLAGNTK